MTLGVSGLGSSSSESASASEVGTDQVVPAPDAGTAAAIAATAAETTPPATDATTPSADDTTAPPADEATTPPTDTPTENPTDTPPDEPTPGDDGTGEPQDPSMMQRDAAPIQALAVIQPSQNITVSVKSLRSGSTTVDGLAGVALQLYASNGSSPEAPGAIVPDAWATCISLASGVCTFTVPDVGTNSARGVNYGKQFWVKQASVTGDYYLNQTLVTGDNTTSGSDRFAQTPYVYRTPALNGGSAITLPSMTGMPSQSTVGAPLSVTNGSTTNRWKTGGSLAISEGNNRYQPTCTAGLKVGILIDLSTSMTGAGITGVKAASKAFVNALKDTGTSVSLFTFGTNAPKNNSATGQNYAGQVVTSANLATFNSRIDGYSASDSTNYTNWDRGLWQVASESGAYDILVVLTDGNPTVYSGNPSTQTWTTMQHVEEAIYSANAVKHEGTQILAFGVGDSIANVAGDNLRAVSGTSEWSGSGSILNYDFAKTTNWSLVSSQLAAAASGLTCSVPIKVVKTAVPLVGPPALASGWSFTAVKTSGSGTVAGQTPQATNASGEASWSLNFTDKTHNGSVSLTEAITSGWAMSSVVCTNSNGDSLSYTANTTTGVISLSGLEVGDNITCQVTNTQLQTSVKVNKNWVVNGTTYADGSQLPSTLTAQLVLGGTNQAWGVTRDGIAINSTTTIKETLGTSIPALCTVDSQILTKPGDANVSVNLKTGTGIYTTPALPPGLTTYLVTNTVTCTSELTLIKTVVNDNGGGAVAANWNLNYALNGANPLAITSGTTVTVAPGAYTLTETALAGASGYAPSATNPLVCTQGLTGTVVTVPIATSVTCTFKNDDKPPTLTLVKVVEGATGVLPAKWTLSATGGGSTPVSGNGTATNTVKANTPYTLKELPVAGFESQAADFTASAWKCQTNGAGIITTLGSDGVLSNVALGDNVTCTITNTVTPVTPTIAKTVESTVQNTDGTWTITYKVTASNPSKYTPITYDLKDTLAFGGSIGATATATGPSPQTATWNGAANQVLATGVSLAANTTHTYTIVANATVPNGAFPAATTCPSTNGTGGFLNTAILTVGATTYPAKACSEPAKPSFQKDAGTATLNADGTWTLTYTLSATNTSNKPLYYSLTDDPQANYPAGVTVLSGSVTPGASYTGYVATWSPATGPGKNTTVASGVTLPAQTGGNPTVQTYTVSVVVKIASSVTTSLLDCTNKGLKNTGTLSSGGQILTDDACLTVVPPVVTHQKTVASTTQNIDGTWTIVYDVAVMNGTTKTGTYSLSDTPNVSIPSTMSLVSAAATFGGSPVAGWNGTSTTTLATDKTIPANTTQHYTITLVVSVSAGVIGTPASLCAGEGSHGFVNSATITVAGVSTDSSACSSPTLPTFTKTFGSAVETTPGSWTVTYTLTARNDAAGARDVYYTLGDLPGFPTGVTTVATPTVTNTTVPATPVDVPWADGELISIPKALAAGAIHTYAVVFTVTVDPGMSEDLLNCTRTTTAGHGFQNSATLTSGVDSITSVACGDITKSVVPDVTKTIKDGYPKQLADGTWEIQYDLVVSTDAGRDSKYTLSDALGYGAGITVVSSEITSSPAGVTPAATWDGNLHTGIVTNQTLPAAATNHTYTVKVIAQVSASAYGQGTTVCLTDGGGFFNKATLTSGTATPKTSSACDSPAQPTFSKVIDPENPPVADSNGVWTVTYLLTATNSSDHELHYNLSDTLGFPDGVDLSDATVTSSDATPAADWNGVSKTGIVTEQLLPANATDIFTVKVKATITDEFSIDDIYCGEGGAGEGFFNTATLTSGGIPITDNDCAEIPLATLTLVKVVDNSAFSEVPLGEHSLATASNWLLDADGPTDHQGVSGNAQVTTVLVPVGTYDLSEVTNPDDENDLAAQYVASAWSCVSNNLQVDKVAALDIAESESSTVGLSAGDDVTCTITNTATPVDLKVVKMDSATPADADLVPTDQDANYHYSITVTNQGEIPTTNTVVTDVIPSTIAVNVSSIVVPAGWTSSLTGDAGGFGGTLTFTRATAFAVDATATFTFTVKTAKVLPRDGDNPLGKISDIQNTAVVMSDGIEATPEDNEFTVNTPVKSISLTLTSVCVKDVPYASYTLTPLNTDGIAAPTISMIWWTPDAYAARNPDIDASDVAGLLADGALEVNVLDVPPAGWTSGVPVTGSQLWPGGSVDPITGIGNGWPGWVKNAQGQWQLDPTSPFFPLRQNAVVEIRMNPSTGSITAYPPATKDCAAQPPFNPPTLSLTDTLVKTGVENAVLSLSLGGLLLGFGALTLLFSRKKKSRH